MKKVIIPNVKEEAVYYTDFNGVFYGENVPPVELTIEFNYGSAFDGSKLKFHLCDKEIVDVLVFLKQKLSKDTLKNLKENAIDLGDSQVVNYLTD